MLTNVSAGLSRMCHDLLLASPAGTAVGGRIYVAIAPSQSTTSAPPSSAYPFILQQIQTTVVHNALGGKPVMTRAHYQVRCVTKEDRNQAEVIQAQIDAAVNGMKGPQATWNTYVIGSERLREIDLPTVEEGVRYFSLGYVYLVFLSSL